VDRADDWFDAHGHWAVLFGRLVPTVRTLVSIPAGLSEMPWRRFLIFSSIGTAAWTALLALLGYAMGSQYERINAWVDPVSLAVIVVIVALYVWRVANFGRRHPGG
jgi:membrane protein DedA with SNARE-associated domain